MKVWEAMKKYRIKEIEMRIYDESLDTEIYRHMKKYYDCEVVRIYPHNGDAVIQVKGLR